VPGSIPGGVTRDFFRCIRQFYVPGVDPATENEYQKLLEVKHGRCVWLTTHHLQVTQEPGAAGTTTNMHTTGCSETSVATEIERLPIRPEHVLRRGKIEVVSLNLCIE
jgi:hypothetical protein